MAGLLRRLVFRTRVVTTWIASLPLRGHGLLLPITAQPDCVSARRRNYHNSPIWLQKHVATIADGASNGHELTAEERKRIDELWKTQESLGAMAETMSKRLSIIWKYLMGSSNGPRPSFEWSDAEHNKLRELRKRRYKYREIAEKLGRPYKSTKSYANRARCTSVAGHMNVYSLEQRDQAVSLLKEGLKPITIAERLGVPVRTIAHMLRRRELRHNWTTEDIGKMLTLREAGSSWREIQVLLSGPSELGISSMYSHLTHAKHRPKAELANVARVRWSPEEDAKLLRLRNLQRLKFSLIAQQMPGRSQWALRNRYNAIDGSLKGAGYLREELEKIARLRASGMTLKDVAAQIPGRTAVAVYIAFYRLCSGKYSVDERGDIIWHDISSHSKTHDPNTSI